MKHIPKAARPGLSALLTTVIGRILREPCSLTQWRQLFAFGALTLAKPTRGGRRHNMTTKVKQRSSDFLARTSNDIDWLFSDKGESKDRRKGGNQAGQTMAAAVASKLEDGNIRAAARILSSDDKPIPINEATWEELKTKHPPPPQSQEPVPEPPDATPLQMTEENVMRCIRNFPAGSAGGPDGLRPQHILELVSQPDSGPSLLAAITALVNLLLAGECPLGVRATLFGGTLFALRKSTGGLRPIVIGYYWRRLAAKCASSYAAPKVAEYLSPRQVGVGVPGGCEAAVHATRRFLNSIDNETIIAKIDFSNAFNSLYRIEMLTALYNILPELAPFCNLAYLEHSHLKYGQYCVLSQVGPQQGDPLGPLLFCLPLQPILTQMKSPLTVGFLDDLTLGGKAEEVAEDVQRLESECEKLGLFLNRTKCEIISTSADIQRDFEPLRQFRWINPSDATLLGAPLSTETALTNTLNTRTVELKRTIEKLSSIATHDAIILLRYSLSATRLLYTLRSCPCEGHEGLQEYDMALRVGLAEVLNLDFTDESWLQATLPIKRGGLGIRSVASLALPAFLASAAATDRLQIKILGGMPSKDPAQEAQLSRWREVSGVPEPEEAWASKQSRWDDPLIELGVKDLAIRMPDCQNQARLRAVAAPHAGDWLLALPITNCGLRLDDESMRVAVGYRLGLPVCWPHSCPCGTLVEGNGYHGLSCSLGPGRWPRHAALNDIICKSLIRAGIPTVKEPVGLVRTDGKRPDGLTHIPWRAGRCLIWDATVSDTMATSYLPETSQRAGAAAERAANLKTQKYAELATNYIFTPMAFETLGPINSEGQDLLSELGHKLSTVTGEQRETTFLYQRISMTIQRFNAVAFKGTFPAQETTEQRYSGQYRH